MMMRLGVIAVLAPLLCAGCDELGFKSKNLECMGYYKDSTAEAKIEACTTLIEDDTRDQEDHALNLHWRGVAYIDARKCDAAVADLDASLALKPKHARAVIHLDRGRAKSCLGRYEEAIVDFDRARALNPKTFAATALIQRGYADLALYRATEAVTDSDQAIALEPDKPYAYRTRGDAHLVLGAYAAAVADFDHALNLKANDTVVRASRGRAHLRLHQYELAIHDFDAVLAKTPGDSYTRSARGFAHRGLGRSDAAERDYAAAVAGKSNDAEALAERCAIRATWNRDLPAALADCDAAARLAPKVGMPWLARAFVHIRMGRYADVIADCDQSIRRRGNSPGALYLRGVAKAKLHTAGADQDIAAALALYPSLPDLYAEGEN